ncbi:aspartate aminotransferase [Liquorilactobacillus sucicola DSM 21376 = JCM 15457]|uniref:Aminotransferase n=1 Tax=Liquorilactobacillus sucicola DSM 21376 = JCM 15457 TaxID=1423806 RepID=A0A023CWD0_9LACO|nr:pyridoxal phosphate-dependent aminotransferase [Liquorilactobacillus sucicola]KRN06199.1 aspartate aminotransferase [Liquorilactobacillus sucicola DSM 21376 = JCM 15457]GAJ26129.1 aspartate aminotransferase [Liquorilactobacillus sucicola DSM 21376 = JCM 15457]
MKIASRVMQVQPSATLALSAKAKKMTANGIDVINLGVGEPDFNTPSKIKQAAIDAIKTGKSDFYTPATGIIELKQAICDRLRKDFAVEYSTDQVAVTVGGKFSLYVLAQTLLDEQDEVLIPLPYWVSYGEQVKLAGGKPVFVMPDDGTKVTVDELEEARSNKTRAVIINSPQNPSGLIYTRDELLRIGEWAVKNDVILIADDMYGKLVYNGHEFVSLIGLSPEIKDQTILVSGLSKAYAMTGWRVGYTVAPREVIQKMNVVISHATSNLAAVSQYAALEALTGDQEVVEKMRVQFEKRLNIIYPQLVSLPGVKLVNKPEGAFYLFPNVAETVKLTGFSSTEDFAAALLEEAHVAVVAGAAFGMPEHIRLSYATDLDSLNEALKRIRKFIEKHM